MVHRILRIFLCLGCITLAVALFARPKQKASLLADGNAIVPPDLVQRIEHDDAVLNRPVADFTADVMPLNQAIASLSRTAGVELQVEWKPLEGAGVDTYVPIHVYARNSTLGQILWSITNEAGGKGAELGFEARGEAVVISTAEYLARDTIAEIYNVRPLIARIVAGAAWEGPPQTEEEALEAISSLIVAAVEGDWQGNGTTSVREWNGLLIIQHSRHGHREIAKLLARLDAELQ